MPQAPAARVTDIAMNPADAHGSKCCAHPVQGPALMGSTDTIVVGQALLRAQGVDGGSHAACCGPNTWRTLQGSTRVFCNDKPVVRMGDTTLHCGGIGSMISGTPNVLIG